MEDNGDDDNDYHLRDSDFSPCQYYTIRELKKCVTDFRHSHNFTLTHMNIRSFSRNYDEFSIFMDSVALKPNILVLSETWFSEDTVTDIDGYTGYHVFRDDRRAGGVSVYVKSNISSVCVSELSYVRDVIEINTIRITLCNRTDVCIIGIYRPPERQYMRDFIVLIGDILRSLPRSLPIYLAGDLNIDLLSQDDAGDELCELLQGLSFIPLITKSTRITEQSATCIDQIWTNQLQDVISGVVKVSVTDHFPVFMATYLDIEISESYIRKVFRDHSRGAMQQLREDILYFVRYFDQFDDLSINSRMNIFLDNLYRIYDKNCITRVKQISKNSYLKPWITNRIKEQIKQKHFLFRQYKRGIIPFHVYNNHKNACVRILRNAKITYFKNIIDSRNPREI